MSGLGAARAQWNAMLLSQVAADAYVSLLDGARSHLGTISLDAYAALWPSQVVGVCLCVLCVILLSLCVPMCVCVCAFVCMSVCACARVSAI
jgi:hypothetical protein